MENQRIKMVAVVGPTASGKSSLAVELAREFGGEVISADSRQVYKGLDIGTGKVTKREMAGIPHHLLSVANPKRKFTVAQFQKAAVKAIRDIDRAGNLPILCGGTGFYIQAVADGVVFPDVKPNARLRKELGRKNAEELAAMLKKIDKKRYGTIDRNNPKRLVRAIEIAQALGKVPNFETRSPAFETLFIGVKPADEALRKRIRDRLFARMRTGMLAEAKRLRKGGLSLKRMKELGLEYRYEAMYLNGELTKKEMLEKLELEIRHYAKRQMTWFKRDARIRWFKPTEHGKVRKEVQRFLKD